MMRALFILLLTLTALPAFAEAPQKIDPDALILKHTEEDVANNPSVVAAKKQVGTAFAADNNAKNSRSDLNRQIEAANEKYLQESRAVTPRTPEEYQQFIESHTQRAHNLNDQLRNTGGTEAQTRKQVDAARKLLNLAVLQARIDNPGFPVFIFDGTSWVERKEDGRLEPRINLHDGSGKTYTLLTPQPIDKLSNASCTYMPIVGEIWAVRGAETLPPEPKAPPTEPIHLKIASLKQIYLLNHAAGAGCPFGQVLVPAPVQK